MNLRALVAVRHDLDVDVAPLDNPAPWQTAPLWGRSGTVTVCLLCHVSEGDLLLVGVTTYGKRSAPKTLAISFFPRRSLRSRLLAAASLQKTRSLGCAAIASPLTGSAAFRFP